VFEEKLLDSRVTRDAWRVIQVGISFSSCDDMLCGKRKDEFAKAPYTGAVDGGTGGESRIENAQGWEAEAAKIVVDVEGTETIATVA